MALNKRSFIRRFSIPYASGSSTKKCNIHDYASTDATATILTAGYFNDLRDTLKVDDVALVVGAVGTAAEVSLIRFVTVPATGDVTVAAAGPSALVGGQAAITLTGVDLTDNSAGAPADTIAALADGTTYANDVAAIRNNFASLARTADRHTVDIAAIRDALIAAGILDAA